MNGAAPGRVAWARASTWPTGPANRWHWLRSLEGCNRKGWHQVEGSYTAELSNGSESLELFGNFRVCRVTDTGII